MVLSEHPVNSGDIKVALITGISQGIGLATAKKFLDAGWRVVGTTRDGSAPIEQGGLDMSSLELSDPESIKKAASTLVTKGMRIDVLINNAAILLDERDDELVVDKLRQTLEINLIGLVDFTERVLPLLKNNGHILNVSSTFAALSQEMDNPTAPAYKISKCALNMYTKTLAKRLEAKKIAVSSVHPGWTKTKMGGDKASGSPADAAEDIFNLAVNPMIVSGQFWYRGARINW